MTTLSKEDVVRMASKYYKQAFDWYAFDDCELHAFIAEARADLAAENEQLKASWQATAIEDMCNQLTATRTALAAAEARETKLMECVKRNENAWFGLSAYWVGSDPVRAEVQFLKNAKETQETRLSITSDDSALREMIAGVYEECAKVCDDLHDQWKWSIDDPVSGPSECRDAIRALAEKAKAEKAKC